MEFAIILNNEDEETFFVNGIEELNKLIKTLISNNETDFEIELLA